MPLRRLSGCVFEPFDWYELLNFEYPAARWTVSDSSASYENSDPPISSWGRKVGRLLRVYECGASITVTVECGAVGGTDSWYAEARVGNVFPAAGFSGISEQIQVEDGDSDVLTVTDLPLGVYAVTCLVSGHSEFDDSVPSASFTFDGGGWAWIEPCV